MRVFAFSKKKRNLGRCPQGEWGWAQTKPSILELQKLLLNDPASTPTATKCLFENPRKRKISEVHVPQQRAPLHARRCVYLSLELSQILPGRNKQHSETPFFVYATMDLCPRLSLQHSSIHVQVFKTLVCNVLWGLDGKRITTRGYPSGRSF